MNFIKGYDSYNIINEALRVSEVKEYIKAWKDSGGEDRYKDMFGGKWRIYLDIQTKSSIEQEVEDILADKGFTVLSYADNKTYKDKPQNATSISKVLNRFAPDLRPQYDADREKERNSDSEYKVVVSRHPYDIAGMSTDRRWRSCMNIRDGINKEYVMEDVTNGSIVAYVIEKHDTNINDPINRLLIKPFENGGDVVLGTDKKVYFNHVRDSEVAGFRDTVEAWLSKHQTLKYTSYTLNKNLYPDGKTILHSDKLEKKYAEYYIRSTFILAITDKRKKGILDLDANVKIPVIYDDINLEKYFWLVQKGGLYGLYDLEYNKICDTIYKHIDYDDIESSNYMIAYEDENGELGNCGVMDIKGDIIIPFQYKYIRCVGHRSYITKDSKSDCGFYVGKDMKLSGYFRISPLYRVDSHYLLIETYSEDSLVHLYGVYDMIMERIVEEPSNTSITELREKYK